MEGLSTIVVSGVAERFGPRWALREVDLGAPPGCVVGLIGGSEAGKSAAVWVLLGAVASRPVLPAISGWQVGSAGG